MPPGLDPVVLHVLYTYETMAGGQAGCRAYVDSDAAKLQAFGEKLKAEKPVEVTSFSFMVLPAEGLPTDPSKQGVQHG